MYLSYIAPEESVSFLYICSHIKSVSGLKGFTLAKGSG